MMRTNLQPLARLVDAAAEKWLAVEHAADDVQQPVLRDIGSSFNIGDKQELVFHGLRYQLCISRQAPAHARGPQVIRVRVHEIESSD